MAGLAAARARGRVRGRPPTVTPQKLAVARQLLAAAQSKTLVCGDRRGQPTYPLRPPQPERWVTSRAVAAPADQVAFELPGLPARRLVDPAPAADQRRHR